MSNEKVELYPAHAWDCPECGAHQFEHGVVFEPSNEDRDFMVDEYGIDPLLEMGFWTTIPEEVACSECNKTFKTKYYEE